MRSRNLTRGFVLSGAGSSGESGSISAKSSKPAAAIWLESCSRAATTAGIAGWYVNSALAGCSATAVTISRNERRLSRCGRTLPKCMCQSHRTACSGRRYCSANSRYRPPFSCSFWSSSDANSGGNRQWSGSAWVNLILTVSSFLVSRHPAFQRRRAFWQSS